MTSAALPQQQAIINNGESPHVKLKATNIGDCRWTDGFWGDKFRQCEETMVPYMGSLLKGDIGHAYNNFKIAAGLKEGEAGGTNWHDGDFYKWMESAMYVYGVSGDEPIVEDLDEIIAVIAKAQCEDGYLSTPVQNKGLGRWTNRQHHELYNSGHLLTSACIHHRLTGKSNFLDIAVKHADYLYSVFQPRPKELARFGFNPSQIMGLVEIYRTTRDKRYLELAQIFVDMRGANRNEGTDKVNANFKGDMCQDRKPFRNETEAVGHAVLAMYFYSGVADVVAETGEKALADALDRIWDNIVDKKMYVTGAVGQTHHGASSRVDFVHEAFIAEYMMPNLTAYNETCANIGNAMFNWRMLATKGESKYADIMELVLYNSAMPGIGHSGKDYFYAQPLRHVKGAREIADTEFPTRIPYVPCFCCPPNLVRTIAKSAGWAYSIADNGVAVNLYGGNKLNTQLADGSTIELTQETNYPWDGKVTITIDACKGEAFHIMPRIPDWAEDATLQVNGQAVEAKAGSYATINREWKAGDVITLNLPMEAKLLAGHPRIEEVRNQAAIKRGPIVYCVETPDLPEDTSILDVYLPSDVELKANHQPDLLGDLTTLSGDVMLRSDDQESMYETLEKPDWKRTEISFVPYYAWCNRGEAEMTVWLPLVWE